MTRYVTIDDTTGAFVHVDDVRGCIPVDFEKQEESGYQTIILTPTRDIPSPLDMQEIRARINATPSAVPQHPCIAVPHSTH